jgi:kynurenine formamidase
MRPKTRTMRIRSFIIAYALLLAILLFADRRPHPADQNRYSHIVDLTNTDLTNTDLTNAGLSDRRNGTEKNAAAGTRTRIIAPDALIPGTWTASQIPAERLIAPLVVMDLNLAPAAQISLDDIATWETQHGAIPQGAVVAIRHGSRQAATNSLPITDQAAQFLMDARYTLGFALEEPADLASDRTLARQLALHGNYVVEGASRLGSIPATGSLIIVAPAKVAAKEKNLAIPPVRVLAMVK